MHLLCLIEFKKFDPINGYVGPYPFTYLPEIAARARYMLSRNLRDHEKIAAITMRIDSEIHSRIDDEIFSFVLDIEERIRPDHELFLSYFEWVDYECAWKLKSDVLETLLEEHDIPTVDACNEVNELRAVIEQRDTFLFFREGEPEEYPEGRDCELFAVLALALLAESIRFSTLPGKYQSNLAGEYALRAMDAIKYADELLMEADQQALKTEYTTGILQPKELETKEPDKMTRQEFERENNEKKSLHSN